MCCYTTSVHLSRQPTHAGMPHLASANRGSRVGRIENHLASEKQILLLLLVLLLLGLSKPLGRTDPSLVRSVHLCVLNLMNAVFNFSRKKRGGREGWARRR